MRSHFVAVGVVLSFLLVFGTLQSIRADSSAPPKQAPAGGWSSFIRGGAVHQFDTDLDDGGSYDADRFTIQAGSGYSWDRRTRTALALGYSYDGYSFSLGSGSGFAPWEDIHSISLSLPTSIGIDESWSTFIIPSVRSSGESGADFDETVTGGLLAGFSYRFGDSLSIGPGIGIFSQLEDSATIIPILIIDWQITKTLSLDTGRGLGATLGPGLALNYRPNQTWNFAVGGRYEKLRFRLDKDGSIGGGVGEDQSFPLFGACTYNFTPKAQLSVVGGVELGGELKLEDKDGRTVDEQSYDPGVFLGLTFAVRL
jgi:hypothetical protein